jgi:hypothetical protein
MHIYFITTKKYLNISFISLQPITKSDVIFDKFRNFNREIIISNWNSRSKHMVLNQKQTKEDEKSFLTNEREYDVGWKKSESFICVFYLH